MLLETILITITLIILFIASYTDLRTKEVPDWISYGFIFMALGIRIIFSIQFGWFILFSGILGLLLCFALALIFYYTSQWGGGDSKLLMGIGASIGISIPFNNSSWDLFLYFTALLILGAIYGLIFMAYQAIRKRKIFTKAYLKSLRSNKKLHLTLLIISILLLILTIFRTSFWPIALLPLGLLYLFTFVDVVEKACFFRKIIPDRLTEGDWLAERVRIGKKILLEPKTLEKEDLWELRFQASHGKIKEVLIKEGVPFIPSFLFAYLALIFGRSLFSWFLGFLA